MAGGGDIEPGAEGTLIEAETRFDVGDGDERPAKKAAQAALRRFGGWRIGETVRFRTLFHARAGSRDQLTWPESTRISWT